jgi:hypothetical protein
MKIKCICIDDKNKPEIIPEERWIKAGEVYHVTHIYKQVNQGNILGCLLSEKDISVYIPYNCFRLSRFAFNEEDLPALIKMFEETNELNNIDISELMEQLEIKREFSNEKVVKSITGYTCPNCGAYSSEEKTMIHATNPEFIHEPDPHLSWEEVHKCSKCKTIYHLKNSA